MLSFEGDYDQSVSSVERLVSNPGMMTGFDATTLRDVEILVASP